MLRKKLWMLIPVFLLCTFTAKADSTAQVHVDGSFLFADNGFGIGPYGGTLNGQAASFFCVDFSHEITGNTGWMANVTGLTNSSGYANTLQKSETTYLEFAWLIQQMTAASTQDLKAQYQWAIWSFTGGGDPHGTNAALDAAAAAAVAGGFTVNGWQILSTTGTYGQEFMVVPTSEPGTLGLLFVGVGVLVAFAFVRK